MLFILNIMLKISNKKLVIYNSGRWYSKAVSGAEASAIALGIF